MTPTRRAGRRSSTRSSCLARRPVDGLVVVGGRGQRDAAGDLLEVGVLHLQRHHPAPQPAWPAAAGPPARPGRGACGSSSPRPTRSRGEGLLAAHATGPPRPAPPGADPRRAPAPAGRGRGARPRAAPGSASGAAARAPMVWMPACVSACLGHLTHAPEPRPPAAGRGRRATPPGGTTRRPSGLPRSVAILAAIFTSATPAETASPHLRPHGSSAARRRCPRPVPWRARLAVTSRNASSSESGSTSGVYAPVEREDRARELGVARRSAAAGTPRPGRGGGPARWAWRSARRTGAPRSWRRRPPPARTGLPRSPDVPRRSGSSSCSTEA